MRSMMRMLAHVSHHKALIPLCRLAIVRVSLARTNISAMAAHHQFSTSTSSHSGIAEVENEARAPLPTVFGDSLDSPFLKGQKNSSEDTKTSPLLVKLFSRFLTGDVVRTVNSAKLYETCAIQSMHDSFFNVFFMPKTYASNLELAILHVWICKIFLTTVSEGRGGFLDDVLERMWEHVARSLLSAEAPTIRADSFLKQIQESAFGSFVSYDHALAQLKKCESTEASDPLKNPISLALSSSLYDEPSPKHVAEISSLAAYVKAQIKLVSDVSFDDMSKGKFSFSDPAEFASQ